MPVVQMTTMAQVNGFLQCEAQTAAVIGRHPQEEPWDVNTVLAFRDSGHKGYVWIPSGSTTVMGGIICKVEMIRGEKWLRIVKAVVRMNALPDGDQREQAILRAAKQAILDAIPDGIAGTFLYVETRNTRLINFLDRTFVAARTREVEDEYIVYIFRLQDGTPELDAATSGLSD